VTDPPYGIGFLGKAWDANTGALETYSECLRVLKPGGHILAFSAARTYHHLAITLESAGFEIRDQIMWIYSSGFPKSQDIGKSIERSENRRKDNALGIKRSKIASGPKTNCPKCNLTLNGGNQFKCPELQCDLRDALAPADNEWAGWGTQLKPAHEPIAVARKPISEQNIAENCQRWGTGAINIDAGRVEKRFPSNVIGEIAEPYQKYFYCPKVNRRERQPGNNHPTVKPLALMEYLIRLVTPAGGHVLDPFNGSGSTGMAAVKNGYNYTGIELDAQYVEISRLRIATQDTPANTLFEELK
jgi:site-specific DNA-methyltransferase (adenine-specific)